MPTDPQQPTPAPTPAPAPPKAPAKKLTGRSRIGALGPGGPGYITDREFEAHTDRKEGRA